MCSGVGLHPDRIEGCSPRLDLLCCEKLADGAGAQRITGRSPVGHSEGVEDRAGTGRAEAIQAVIPVGESGICDGQVPGARLGIAVLPPAHVQRGPDGLAVNPVFGACGWREGSRFEGAGASTILLQYLHAIGVAKQIILGGALEAEQNTGSVRGRTELEANRSILVGGRGSNGEKGRSRRQLDKRP